MNDTKILLNPVQFYNNVWAYPSRSGKSLEFYVQGNPQTQSFRISFAKLSKIKRALRQRKRK